MGPVGTPPFTNLYVQRTRVTESPVPPSSVTTLEGGAVVIFPEGGRGESSGKMLRFKGGAVRLALEAAVPILPITIRGGHRVWPAGRHVPLPAPVEIIYHELFQVEQRVGEETRACARRETERLAAIIKSAL